MSLLAVTGLSKHFGGITAVDDVSFDLAAGEMAAMIGPNGAGKSTLFNLIGGQLRPDQGRVVFAGRTITGASPRAIWRAGVGRTFQVAATFASMTVAENVQMTLISRARRLYGVWTPASALFRDAALALLERVGMADAAERACGVLAYGDVKRVEIAIALAGRPRLLMMDEPTAGMAADERDRLMRLIGAIAADDGLAVLFTEHDMDVVFAHAGRIMVLARGRLIADGPPAAVRDDAEVQRVYLGAPAPGRGAGR